MFFAIASLGTVALSAILLQQIRAMFVHWQQSVRQFRLVGNRASHATEDLDARLKQTKSELSLRRQQAAWREVIVAKIDKESADVRSFYLVDADAHPLSPFLPGQHIVVERPAENGRSKDSRCYSLSDDCLGGHWRISVKKASDRSESFSRWLHEEIATGDRLRVRGPSGSFYLNAEPGHNVVLASAGIGLTPMLPMLIECMRKQVRSVHLFAQFRDTEHMPFASSLLHIAQRYPHLGISLWISKFPNGVRKTREGIFREGKFTASDLLKSVDVKGQKDAPTDVYMCGPEPWQKQLTSDLIQQGMESERVHYELFNSPSDESNEAASAAGSSTAGVARKVVFAQSGASARFEPAHRNLLNCASKNQISLESGCRSGNCGACAVRILEGKVRYLREPQFQTRSNEILTCICVPDSDLIVDA